MLSSNIYTPPIATSENVQKQLNLTATFIAKGQRKSERLWRSDFFFLNCGVNFSASKAFQISRISFETNFNFFLPESNFDFSKSFRMGLGTTLKKFAPFSFQSSKNTSAFEIAPQVIFILPAKPWEFRPWISYGFFPKTQVFRNANNNSLLQAEFAAGLVESPISFFVWKNRNHNGLNPLQIGVSAKIPIF